MIKQTNNYAGGHAEPPTGNSADREMSSGRIKNPRTVEPQRTAITTVPKGLRHAEMRILEAHVERRGKLAAQIRAENPSRTEEEIEARLEQFGA